MQYFSKRFSGSINPQMLHFHSSISFDKRLATEDIIGSMAHVKGLVKQGILTQEEGEKIEKGLADILEEIKNNKFIFCEEYEDIHMNIEKELINRIGEVAKKLHTGRSRNDQVAVDMKLFVKKELKEVKKLLKELIVTILKLAKNNLVTYMPAFTHLQKAQVTTFSHYLMAYVEMFYRDICRLENTIELLNSCPLGAAALTGTTHNLDRDFVSELLGFDFPTRNSLDSVSDRDYIADSIHDFSLIMVHLSRFCEEIILFSSQDYGYIEVSDSFSTGSSIMPQKKNPDAAELIRGKSGRVFGNLISILTVLKGLSLAYNKDLQEDKESFFEALDTTKSCIVVFTGMIDEIIIKNKKMEEACYNGYIEATDIADYLSKKGMAFRDAYAVVGKMVKDAIASKSIFPKWPISEYKKYSELFDEDIFEAITLEKMVESRTTIGSPKKANVEKHISEIEEKIKNIN